MSKISLIAKLTARDGQQDEVEAGLANLVAAADEEPGLEIYSFHRSDDEPGVYYVFELYTDAAAWDAHGKGERMTAARSEVGELLTGPAELTMMTPIASKGIDA